MTVRDSRFRGSVVVFFKTIGDHRVAAFSKNDTERDDGEWRIKVRRSIYTRARSIQLERRKKNFKKNVILL